MGGGGIGRASCFRLINPEASSNSFLTIFVYHFQQVLSINKENAPVALWELFSRHAVVILPLCTADQQQNLAHLLVRSITQETQASRPEKPGYASSRYLVAICEQASAFSLQMVMNS